VPAGLEAVGSLTVTTCSVRLAAAGIVAAVWGPWDCCAWLQGLPAWKENGMCSMPGG
jgi:hypothetical protein